MTLTQLRYLLAIVDQGGFGRAAEHCQVTQPTMSAQIRKLEEELDVRLFERTGGGVQLTPTGRLIVQYARGLIELAQAIQGAARDSGGLPGGALRLGVVPSAAPTLLTTAIRAVREEVGGIRIDMYEGSPADLCSRLKNCDIDLIIGPMPTEEPGLRWLPLFWEPYVLTRTSCGAAEDSSLQHTLESGTPGYVLDEGGAVETCSYGATTSMQVGLQDHIAYKANNTHKVASIATLNALLNSSDCIVIAPFTAALLIGGAGVSQTRLGAPHVGRTMGFVWRASYPWTQRCYEIYDVIHANLPDGVVPLKKVGRDQIAIGFKSLDA